MKARTAQRRLIAAVQGYTVIVRIENVFNRDREMKPRTKTISIDCETLPVMKSHCASCPFKEINGKWQNVQLANEVISRTLFRANQICHGTEGKKRKPNNRCKGAFDHNSEIYKRMGFGHLVK